MGIASLAAAGISGAGSIFGASKASSAANKAANAQVKSAQIAADTQRQMFGEAKNALQPYMDVGNDATYELRRLMGQNEVGPDIPGSMTQASLSATPGYQFTLGQGLKSVQNSAAARGLGVSGAALKGAATYATGLSDQTYNNRFNQQQQQYTDAVTNQTNEFNRLYQVAGIGQQAGSSLADGSIKTGSGIAASQTGAGSAQAAGINGAGQAISSGIVGVAGAASNGLNQSAFNNALSKYLNGGNGAGTSGLFSSAANPANYNSSGFQGWLGYGG